MIPDAPIPFWKTHWPWSLLAGLGLIVALAVSPTAPGWLFWGAVATSCVGAFIATFLDRLR